MALSRNRHICVVFTNNYVARSISKPFRVGSAFLAICFLVSNSPAIAQYGTPNHPLAQIQRDEAGVAAITRALNAMGGVAAFSALKDTKAEASCTRVSNAKTDTHAVRWATAGDYFRFDGGENDPRGIYNGPGGTARVIEGKTVPVNTRSMRALRAIHLPGLLLFQELAQAPNAIRLMEPLVIGGISTVHVKIIDTKATLESMEPVEEDWYFDPESGLPLKLTYSAQALNSRIMFVRSDIEYSEYATSQGVRIPNTIRSSIEGGPTTTCKVSTFVFNQGPDPSVFSPLNAGGR